MGGGVSSVDGLGDGGSSAFRAAGGQDPRLSWLTNLRTEPQLVSSVRSA